MSKVYQKHYEQIPDLQFVLGKIHEFRMEAFVYGGYVRDTLRNVPFQDMDVQVSCREIALAFIQSIEESNRMIHLETRTTKYHPELSLEYQCYTMVIQTPMNTKLKIDISYSDATSLEGDSLGNCDFTANNLMIDYSGKLSTRIKAYQIGLRKKFSEAEWLAKCIRDCIDGKLVWMIPDRFSKNMGTSMVSQIEFMKKMNLRLQKMLSKGFTLTGEHLTSFRLANAVDVNKMR